MPQHASTSWFKAVIRRICGKEKSSCIPTSKPSHGSSLAHAAPFSESKTMRGLGNKPGHDNSAAEKQCVAVLPTSAQKGRPSVDDIDSDLDNDASSEDESAGNDPSAWNGGRPRGALRPPVVGRPPAYPNGGHGGSRPGGTR